MCVSLEISLGLRNLGSGEVVLAEPELAVFITTLIIRRHDVLECIIRDISLILEIDLIFRHLSLLHEVHLYQNISNDFTIFNCFVKHTFRLFN